MSPSCLRGPQVVAERLLDDDAPPRVLAARGEAGAAEAAHDDGELRGRRRQVEEGVAAGGRRPVEPLLQGVVGRGIVEVALDVAEGLGEGVPGVLGDRGARVLLGLRAQHGAQALVAAHVGAADAEHHQPGRQEPPHVEVVERRHELAAGEVAGDAEDHDGAGARDVGQAEVVPQGVRLRGWGDAHDEPPEGGVDGGLELAEAHARDGPARVAQGRGVAGRLRVDERAEAVRAAGDGQVGGLVGQHLQEDPGRRAALVQLARRVQVARAEARRGRDAQAVADAPAHRLQARLGVVARGDEGLDAHVGAPGLGRRERLADVAWLRRRQLPVLLVRGEQVAREHLGRLDVGLVERVDAEHAPAVGGRELPRQHLPAEVLRRRRRRAPRRDGRRPAASRSSRRAWRRRARGRRRGRRRRRRARPARSSASGTTPVPSLPVDSAMSCSSQRPKRPSEGDARMRQLVAPLAGQAAEHAPSWRRRVVRRRHVGRGGVARACTAEASRASIGTPASAAGTSPNSDSAE